MKKHLPLFLFLVVLACLSGYLLSKPSLIGRVGIDMMYKQYRFLKTWWQGALFVFFGWMIVWTLEEIVQRKLSSRTSRLAHASLILAALIGFYFTWSDFRHTTTHRWLKERFHLGAYLFWIGWILISIYYLAQKKQIPQPEVAEL